VHYDKGEVMTLLGWGFDPYGLTPNGSPPSGEGVSLYMALAVNTQEVRVYLTGEVLHKLATQDGDALNPATWTVQRLDTLEYLNVMTVVEYTPTIFGLVVVVPFADATVTYEVSSVTLLDASGGILIPPRSATFAGLVADAVSTAQARLANRGAVVRDIANPPASALVSDAVGGTLVVTSSGDYATVSGAELVKKLIIRRLTTGQGEFFHLPNYGVDLGVKEPVRTSQLAQLKTSIERQIRKEPEIKDVSTSLSLDTRGILTVAIKAVLQPTGETLQFAVAGVSL
jgi:hypothetical protein